MTEDKGSFALPRGPGPWTAAPHRSYVVAGGDYPLAQALTQIHQFASSPKIRIAAEAATWDRDDWSFPPEWQSYPCFSIGVPSSAVGSINPEVVPNWSHLAEAAEAGEYPETIWVVLEAYYSQGFLALARWRHQAQLEVSLSALAHNFNYYRSHLQSGTRTMVMVKAGGYGTGAFEIARCLELQDVGHLAVAYVDEGVALRRQGITAPILVLNVLPSAFPQLIRYDLEAEIYSLEQLRELQSTAEEIQPAQQIRIHLKLETGLNRLGLGSDELPDLVEAVREASHLMVYSVFSHLAAADDPDQKAFTLQQLARYREMANWLEEQWGFSFLRHLANSSAVEHYPEAHFDMVRLGIGVYGVSSNPHHQARIALAARLTTRVAQVKSLEKGETVSYGRQYVAPHATRIAVISMGYADGFPRLLSAGRGRVAIAGKIYPVIGRVCMDLFMVEVGEDLVKAGDEVEIFGTSLRLQEVARDRDSIPYEVLTSVAERVPRRYWLP